MAYEVQDASLVNHYSPKTLSDFSVAFMRGLGATADEAAIISDGLMTASQWWHPGQGQGLEKLFRYTRRVKNGGIRPDAPMAWLVDAPAYALLDAAKGFGYVAAQRAMTRAIDKARTAGIAMVGVRHSNHFGIAGYHALTAAKQGLIGWACTNAAAEMAPWGSAQVVLGTNPWGIAIPRSSDQAIVLDMALTMSGKGMMRWYERENRPMPANWALTPAGQATTDPAAAMTGPLLPIGEYKGYGLSLFTDVLAGVMTGALFGLDVFQDDTNFDVGHMMIAIDPAALMTAADFDRRLEELVGQVKGAEPIDPERPVMLPGEVEFRRMSERQGSGIPVARETVDQLRALAAEIGVDFTL
ncbi:MAG: Ldh family oxidoreductase [Chloroflexota bacterium]|nr:Ldh family oxidoreductase [Chloroflexota bacterium]MDE2945482.1 Ldh family oxidoreductase [Chloroflexota bacterium]